MEGPRPGADTPTGFPRLSTRSADAVVEVLVVVGQHAGRLFPGHPVLAVVKVHQLRVLVSHPLGDEWMIPQLRAPWILEVKGDGQLFAEPHQLMRPEEELVGALHTRSLLALEVAVPPNVLAVRAA